MSKLMQQISVWRYVEDSKDIAAFSTWVEVDKRLKVGSKITFKDPDLKDHLWTITQIYDRLVEMDQIDYHGWDNNNYDKHKGLDL